MQRERLLFGVAAVLAGIATVEFVLGFVYSPVLFAVAVPFAAAAYLVWYHASGRLRERVESGRAGSYRGPSDPRGDANRRAGADQADAGRGGFGAGPRDSYSQRRGGFGARGGSGVRGGSGARGRAGARRGGARTGRGERVQQNAGPSPAEAYRVLDLDPGADPETVRQAYREKVKAVHPDRDSGDEEAFKRVNEAYEVLRELK